MEQPWLEPAGRGRPPTETYADRRRENGRIAGILFTVGAIASTPANLLLADPAAPTRSHVMTVVAAATGLICLAIPWGRLAPWCFHLLPTVATVEVALSVWAAGTHGSVFSWYYVFIAVFAGYAFASRIAIGAHLAFASLAFAAPVLYGEPSSRQAFISTLVSVPVLLVAAGVVSFLRERLETGSEAFKELAERDALTGVGNYRTLSSTLSYELARHERHSRPFAVLMLDLDHFKEINETHGHLEGDRVLRDVGRVLRETVREQDTIARQGGDEFSVLAPETDAPEAVLLCERVRHALETIVIGDRSLTTSVGLAVYPEDGSTPEALLARADSLSLRSKREQRLVSE